MPKSNPLAQALDRKSVADTTNAAPPSQPHSAKSPSRSRTGRVLVGGFYTTEVQRQLKVLAAQEGSTVQALLAEGINTVFAKRGKPEIADMSTRILSAPSA